MSNRELSVHTEHEFLLKMETAGLDELLAQRVIQSKDNELAKRVVVYIESGALEIEFWKRKIWKTIKCGTGLKTTDNFRKAIKKNSMKISDWANDILAKITAASQETELDLVKLTVAELGFKSGARRDQIYAKAKELGLELCPAEVGPQLRLQYQDQPKGERILIGMEPITDLNGDLSVFRVERDDSVLWLYCHYDNSDDFWESDNQWVLVRPRK